MDHEHGADGTEPEREAGEPVEPERGARPAEPPYISNGEPNLPSATGSEPAASDAPPRWETTAPTPPVIDPQPAPEPPPSWAWSTGQPNETPASDATAAVAPVATPKRSGRARSALAGGIAGALVGALVAGGLLVVFDDDPSSQPVSTVTQATTEAARPATQVVQPGDIRSILDAARPAVVRIDVGGGDSAEGTGTGFIIDPSGVIATNAHVVNGFNTVTVHLASGDALSGKVVGSDGRLDLAIVKVNRTGLPTLALGDSDTLQVGDGVVAIGNALGLSAGSGATVTTGIISGLDRVVDVGSETLFNAIQTDAAINPGNSGGPLVDMNGKVIGINTAIASPDTANNVGFAISISSARPVIEALRSGREPQIAFLGVTTEPLTPDAASRLKVDAGAVVTDVAGGSGASKSGIKNGDVIVSIDDNKVNSVEDVASEVRKHNPGEQIDVVVVRDGQRQTIKVTLGDRPQNS
jgi:putative serine protease PepD